MNTWERRPRVHLTCFGVLLVLGVFLIVVAAVAATVASHYIDFFSAR